MIIDYLGHGSTTFANELQQAGKYFLGDEFQGVYARNRVPNLTGYAIINIDSIPGTGGVHWYARAANGDSYDGLLPSGLAHDVEMSDDDKLCGQLSLAWCILHSLDRKMAMLV